MRFGLSAMVMLVVLGGCASTQAVESNQAAWRELDRREADLVRRIDALKTSATQLRAAHEEWWATARRLEGELRQLTAHPAWPGMQGRWPTQPGAETHPFTDEEAMLALRAVAVMAQIKTLEAEPSFEARRQALLDEETQLRAEVIQVMADRTQLTAETAAIGRAESRRRAVLGGVAAGLGSLGESLSTWRPSPRPWRDLMGPVYVPPR